MAPERTQTTDPIKPLARLVQSTLTVADIVNRPLWCLRSEMLASDALNAMIGSGFDVGGVAGFPVSHYVRREALVRANPVRRVRALMEPILASQCVEQSLPIGRLLELMIDQDLLFVLDGSHVAWMLNHSDLSAPAVSIAVLAHLAAIEEGVKELAKEYSQTHVFETMSAGREKADENFRMLKQKNIEVSLLDCFYFKDWMAFVRKTDDLRNALGFPSRDEFRNFAKVLSDLRNHTAHGRGILAGSSDPRKALSNVGRAIDFARKVWQLVDQQLPIWDRFASTEIVFPKGAKTPLAGVAARKSWPWSGACHVITAWNPAGIWSHDSQNRKANSRLAENLKRHNYLFEPVIGRSPDGKWREESFLVHGLRRQQAADLGLDFAQTAVFELDKDNLNVVRCSDGEVVRTRSRLQDPSDIC